MIEVVELIVIKIVSCRVGVSCCRAGRGRRGICSRCRRR